MPKMEHMHQVGRTLVMVIGIALALFAVSADWLVGGKPGLGLFQLSLLLGGLSLCLMAVLAAPLAARLLLALGSVAVAMIAAELVLRLFYAEHFTGNLRPHPRYLFELTPRSVKYATRLRVNGGQTNVVRINSSGYRGEELQPPGRRLRVVVYGDSYVEAEYSDLKDTFVWRLQEKLAIELSRPIELINAGVRAYGPDQASLRMEDELPRLRPDLVILVVYAGNDFGDLLRNKLYSVGPDGSVQPNSVALSDSLATQFRLAQVGGLVLLKFCRKLLAPRPPEALPPYVVEQWIEQKDREYREATGTGTKTLTTLADPYDVDVSTAPESPQAVYQKRLMRAVLANMQRAADRNRTRLLLLIIPSPTDICEECGDGTIDSVRFPAYRRSALADALQEIANREQIEAFNLFRPAWIARASEIYFRGGDDHWNDRGQALAAELVGNYIITQGLLQPGAAAASRPVRGQDQ